MTVPAGHDTTIHGMLLLQELTKRAEDMGINWGLEVINRYESNVCNTGLRVRTMPCIQLYHPNALSEWQLHPCNRCLVSQNLPHATKPYAVTIEL